MLSHYLLEILNNTGLLGPMLGGPRFQGGLQCPPGRVGRQDCPPSDWDHSGIVTATEKAAQIEIKKPQGASQPPLSYN